MHPETEKSLEKILEKDFSLNLVECELTQCIKDNPKIFKGMGFIQQKKNKFFLQIFCSNSTLEMFNEICQETNQTIENNTVFNEEKFYNLSAKDQMGNEWISHRQSVSYDLGSHIILVADLDSFERRSEIPTKTQRKIYSFFTPQKIDLPWHVTTNINNQSITDKFEFKSQQYEWTVQKKEQGTEILFVTSEANKDINFENFLYSLSVLCGEHIQPIIFDEISNNTITTFFPHIHSHSRKTLGKPLFCLQWQQNDFHNFILCCLNSSLKNDHFLTFYGFWHRVACAAKNDIENASLILSVSIEGVLNETFDDKFYTDQLFKSEVEKAKPILKRIENIHKRVVECIFNSLGNATKSKPKDKIRKLIEYGMLDTKHLKSWSDLRNTGAHGVVLEHTKENFQNLLKNYTVSLDLFYKLLFIKIQYNGRYINRLDNNFITHTFTIPPNITL